MDRNAISIRQTFDFAWPTYKKHYKLFTAILLTLFGSWAALEIIVIVGQRLGIFLWVIAHLLFFILFAGLEVGFIQITLALYDGREVDFSNLFRTFACCRRSPDRATQARSETGLSGAKVLLFSNLDRGAKFFAGQLLYLVMLMVGLVLLIVPGFYLAAQYVMSGFYLASSQSDIKSSFQQSAVLSQGAKVSLLSLLTLLFLLNVIGASFLGLGLLVTIPLSVLMMTSAFRQLNKY